MKITESDIEQLAIELLTNQGYHYFYGPDIAPESDNPQRHSFDEVLLIDTLQTAIARLNPSLPTAAQDDAFNKIQRIDSTELIVNNETFHRFLTEGIPVNYQQNGHDRGDLIWLVDFENPANNEFTVVNQFTVLENHLNKRPDLILFINGLPLIVIELKNPTDEKATLQSAYQQLQTYQVTIPSLFTYNGILIIADGLEARAGTLSANISRFMAWKSADGQTEASQFVNQLEILIKGMLNKATVLDLMRHFIVFEKSNKEEVKAPTVATVKKLAAYHQYYAVNKAVESTLRATKFNVDGLAMQESAENYGLPSVQAQPKGDCKGGVIWHTQGSGKSLSMVFYVGKMVLKLANPTIVIITDRNDLDDQLFDTFAAAKQLLRQEPIQADDRQHLKALLKVASGGVVFTTIQKFQPDTGNVYETLSERANIIVIADEAHRTQYGFSAKNIDEKDTQGQVIGQKMVYGFAKYLRDALPNATYLGFTGTPIEGTDINTPKVFGAYVDIYDIAQAVDDGATVPIYYESRLAKIKLSEKGKKLVKELDADLAKQDLSTTKKAKAKWTQLEALIGSKVRIKNVASDIVNHFEQRQLGNEGKGMIVAMSRRIAVQLYEAIIKLKPHWHSDDLEKGAIKVVMTALSSDGPEMAKHYTTKAQRRALAERMKNPNNELELVIVRDMWLTGFDAPCLHTLYIDKPMQGHNLMQAIARVNRVYKDKPGGLVVDYLGIASDLKKALSFYSESGGKGNPTIAQEQAVILMQEKFEVVSQLFYGFPYQEYFSANTTQKLSWLLKAADFILGLENGKKRLIDEVTKLSKAFALAIPHEHAMAVKQDVAFFQAVKARLVKFDVGASRNDRPSDVEIETAIRQVIDEALVSNKVVDIFDAAGIKKPDISILSEEFLLEIQGMEHKNVAIEVLKKLLNDEIKARAKKNLVQSKTLTEMLTNALQKYHHKIITAAELIDKLIQLSKEIQQMDKKPAEMGLSEFEYAFYTAVASNNSAMELMKKDKLRELAIVLTERVKQNTSIDWTKKQHLKANLKVIVKRTLRQFGYPPDMQELATETVLKQAELIATELVSQPTVCV